ncbi:MAG: hypothetical protein K6A14_07805 [Erysipelotrichaceae bacterium]|nr:hypothetical protein [Erysipelotrichaceae bacterium]
MKKSGNKDQLIIVVMNILIILGVLAFFGIRLLDTKERYDQQQQLDIHTDPLADVLISNIDLLQRDRLYDNGDGSYSYKGYADRNYVTYNGILYRIVEITAEKNIVLISNQAVTLSPLSQRDAFNNKPLYYWLNATREEHTGIFESTLNNKTEFLTECTVDFSALTNAANAVRTSTGVSGYVTLLSVYQYKNCGANESFLNNGEKFWLSNVDGNGFSYYVDSDGSIKVAKETSFMLAVRPVITVKNGLKVLGGSGSSTDPYVINENDPYQAKNIWVGSIVKYSDILWRVTEKDSSGNIILTSLDIAMREEGPVSIRQAHNNVYNLQTGAGYYFNRTYVKNLYRYSDFLVKRDWPLGGTIDTEYFDYRDSFQRSLYCYIYLPTSADMFLNDKDPCRLILYDPYTYSKAYSIYESRLKLFDVAKEGNYRICVCMNGSLMVADGIGTTDEPYILEVDE